MTNMHPFIMKYYQAWFYRRKMCTCLFATLCAVAIILVFLTYTYTSSWGFHITITQAVRHLRKPIELKCHDVLHNMVHGQWQKRAFSKPEMDSVQQFLFIAREQHFLPFTLQRPDNRCGNVSFDGFTEGSVHSLLWFRALCDPNGDAACCYNNKCTIRSVQECMCKDCYDLRQCVHGELATWQPLEPACKMTVFESEEEVCQALTGMTIYFIGDSLVRHLYIALLQLLRANKFYGPLMEYTSPGMLMACNEHLVYLGMCVNVLDREVHECNNKVKLKFMEYPKASQSNLTLEAVAELNNVSNAMLVLGIGVHEDFDAEKIIDQILLPVMGKITEMPRPRPLLLWSAIHAPGLLKTPRVPSQSRESMLSYNARIRQILLRYNVAEFNTFNVTDGTMSYDGLHYGKGVNHVKAQIFLNYILELKGRLRSES